MPLLCSLSPFSSFFSFAPRPASKLSSSFSDPLVRRKCASTRPLARRRAALAMLWPTKRRIPDSNERNDERLKLKSAQSGSGDAAVDDAADVDERDDERLEAALSDLLRSSSSTTLYPPLDSTDAADRVADHARAANADRAAVAALSVPLASRAAGDEPPLPALAQLLSEQTAPTALRSAANAVPRTAVADGGVEVQHRAQLAHFVGAAQRWLELVNGASADSWRELLQRTRLRQDAIIDVCFRSTSRRPAHYVAVDDNLRAIVLAVRSTQSIKKLDLILNAKIKIQKKRFVKNVIFSLEHTLTLPLPLLLRAYLHAPVRAQPELGPQFSCKHVQACEERESGDSRAVLQKVV